MIYAGLTPERSPRQGRNRVSDQALLASKKTPASASAAFTTITRSFAKTLALLGKPTFTDEQQARPRLAEPT